MRLFDRKNDEMRPVSFERHVNKYAEGSCLVKFGDTHVLCTASVDERLPAFLRNSNKGGWLTAEYNMLPRATHSRSKREVVVGKQSGRSLEIQRLIGRSLRSIMDLKELRDMQITIDCDVLQADGGTRTASITGAWVALYDCLTHLQNKQLLSRDRVLKRQLAAVSCGLYKGELLLDLDYQEDSCATADANFVFSNHGDIIEVQATAEESPIQQEDFLALLTLAQKGVADLMALQKAALLADK